MPGHDRQLSPQDLQSPLMAGRAKMVHFRYADIFRPIHGGPIPDTTARQDIDDLQGIVRLIDRVIVKRVAAQVDQQIDGDILRLRRVCQQRNHVSPEAEADQHETGLGILLVQTVDFSVKIQSVVELAQVDLAETQGV